MTYPNKRDCEHGQLRRSCNICEYENEIKELTLALDAAKADQSRKAKNWDYYQEFCKAHGTTGITNLVVQRDDLKNFIESWAGVGHLQTFEDRERFRKDATLLLDC